MAEDSVAPTRPIIEVSPETLSFELFPNSQPGCVLSVSNASDVTIAFKVKTTEPRRYLVRPNQGIIGPRDIEAVNVYLIEKECNQLLREGLQVPASLGKVSDKFLVQTAGLGERESALLTAVPAPKQSEALTKIWTTFSKTAIRNKKLGVRISLASSAAASVAAAKAAAAGGGGVQTSPARPPGVANSPSFASPGSQSPASAVAASLRGGYGGRDGQGGVGARGGVAARGAGGGGGVGGGGLDENSRVLANKYDDLVNYTANLTEERDELNASLEEAKKALQREMATRIALESKGQMHSKGRKGSTRTGVRPPANQQPGGGGGFGLLTLSLVAASFFFLGHWLDLASGGGGGGGGGAQLTGVAPVLHDTAPQDVLSNTPQIEATVVDSAAGGLPIDSATVSSAVGVGTAAASSGEAGGRSEL